MANARGIFSILPAAFFSPLSSPNREDYAACLLIFYRLFQDSPGGVERAALVGRFAEHYAETGVALEEEPEGESADDAERDAEEAAGGIDPHRMAASRTLRILISAGWVGEETLPDYTRMVTIAAPAKPFLDALAATERGGVLEYESHVVAIYSSLCTDAAEDHGHHAVLNAHYHLTLLIDSLKVLSQNIRAHYERLLEETAGAEIPDILRLHYDRYLEEVVDRAYSRLKTSDNLSRYRPRIARAVNGFLADKKWMDKTSSALALLRRESAEAARKRLTGLLEEIRDQLRSLDPTLDEIDRRNMLYARSSLERIRSRLRSDGSASGRLTVIARAVAADGQLAARLAHRLHRVRWIGKESRYKRWFRESVAPRFDARPAADDAALEKAEAELRLRIDRQLSAERVAAWLDERIPAGSLGRAGDLATDAESFVRILYATTYGESRPGRFPYAIEWLDGEVSAAGWIFRAHGYRRKK
ncbi:MAG: Wadjet anti-phage system protein JetA family protein [Treponemataceae bacterium]